jgi:hypothetical protein
MARCGIRWRYPVVVEFIDVAGGLLERRVIGEAETLREARELAEGLGFSVGEGSRFVADGEAGFVLLSDDDGPIT